jgi:hypothetical protein
MKANRWEPAVVALCALAAGCSSVTLAPGADQVKVTRDAADVAACVSLGNVATPAAMLTDPDAERQMQNETLGFGGNVLLLTSSFGRTGAAYRCGEAAPPPTATAPPPAATSPGQTAAPAAVARAVPPPNEVVQAQVAAFNRHDLEGLLNHFADDAQFFEYPDQLRMAGKDALRDHFRKLFEAPQLHASILNRITLDRLVADHEKVTGLADGRVIEALVIYEVKDGRIVRVTLHRR